MANVLVVGSGGREHALSWKLSQSSAVDTVFTAPGNGGTRDNVFVAAEDIGGLAGFAEKNDCFTVVGPEVPLSMGIVDLFRRRNLEIFGPTGGSAQLESSKIWAKQFMKGNGIPTAGFEVFDDRKEALEYVASTPHPVVVKADGLAAGKGVFVCSDAAEAEDAVDAILGRNVFGRAGSRIVVEERIDGVEASYIALCDGDTVVPMAASQDHKRIYDGDRGPNTGGMGAYSPTPAVDAEIAAKIQSRIIEPTVSAMKGLGLPFQGFLYAGIMVRDGEPYVLEFNTRMGDPECQPIVMRMDFDLYEYLLECSRGRLSRLPAPRWKSQSAVCVVLASRGYPGKYPRGEEITGLGEVRDGMVFHAGTRRDSGRVLTTGGRVLGVTALGSDLRDAVSRAYSMADKIRWPHKHCRTDIGSWGLSGADQAAL